jgi:hypothetical protein
LNRSSYSSEASASATGGQGLVAHLHFDGNTTDSTKNLNHGAAYGTVTFPKGKTGSGALALDGTKFVQIPADLANQEQISIATWVYWNGGNDWQRIFDFGSGESAYMFLSPASSSGQMRFAIRNGGAEQGLDIPKLPKFKWTHIVATLGASGVRLYVNGQKVGESTAITIRPRDYKPMLNYIGRSQFATDPLFNGNIDDFKVFNYVLSPEEAAKLAGVVPDAGVPTGMIDADCHCIRNLSLWPIPAADILHLSDLPAETGSLSGLTVYDLNGSTVLSKERFDETQLDVSTLSPGFYVLQLSNGKESVVRKLLIRR